MMRRKGLLRGKVKVSLYQEIRVARLQEEEK
jgi:hypothetical protein